MHHTVLMTDYFFKFKLKLDNNICKKLFFYNRNCSFFPVLLTQNSLCQLYLKHIKNKFKSASGNIRPSVAEGIFLIKHLLAKLKNEYSL